ncbi:62_t:CDS:2 [Dentiscutata heterogama]|uniref:62_t:CDS:1 n=1 Tax=Dentiscutata heterogama TaxID=1316150 RepID=A0ACA9M3X8_9GLOM|nr:62_t:CDS:2 [Dentiscutata heterogama]
MEKVAGSQFDIMTMEDYHVVASSLKGTQFHKWIREDAYYYKMLQNCLIVVVCDGHGCTRKHNKNDVVELLLSSLISSNSDNKTLLEKELQKLDGEPDKDKIKEIINHVFESLDKDIVKMQNHYEFGDIVGTTATIALIFNKTTYVVHRGDSPAYVGYKNGEINRITADHNLDTRNEYWMLMEEVEYPHLYDKRYWLDDSNDKDGGGVKVTTFFGNTHNFTSKKFPRDPPQEREINRRYSTLSGFIEISNENIEFIFVTSDGFGDVERFLRESVKRFRVDDEKVTKDACFLMGKEQQFDLDKVEDDATFIAIFFKQRKDEAVEDLYKRINKKEFTDKSWYNRLYDKEERFTYLPVIKREK